MAKVRDRLWLWGHPAGSHNQQYGLVQPSHITPADAAAYMGLRNVLMVRYLDLCDAVMMWTWRADNLAHLEAKFARIEASAVKKRKILGLYMYDYGTGRPMPVNLMARQCEMGLRWLKEGRIEGMIFLASCICDLGLDAVEWTRSWIAKVGDQKI